tara:strand:+ start:2456 stop:3436 length:981 start_codon:yes stop_codon:yes gene_type:complete
MSKHTMMCVKEYPNWDNIPQAYKSKNYQPFRCTPDDCGFGQKLLFWRQCQLLNHLCNGKYDIQFRRSIFPEHVLFNLPDTTLIDDPNELDSYTHVDGEHLHRIFASNKVYGTLDDNIIINSWMLHERGLFPSKKSDPVPIKVNTIKDPISKIELKYPEFEKIFKRAFGKYYTVHVRRMNGIWFGGDDLDDLPVEVKKLYKREKDEANIPSLNSKTFRYITDTTYQKQMDEILLKDPNAHFYICSDGNPALFYYWRRKYNIITQDDVLDQFKCALSLRYDDLNDYLTKLYLDFVAMAYSKGIIAHDGSAYNMTASLFRGAKLYNVHP